MEIINKPVLMQAKARSLQKAGKRIGFVPTMGFLHAGHLSLVQLARRASDVVIVSIFVNPAQFGPNEDFAAYPRDLERDCRLCADEGVDIVFNPNPSEMYPENTSVYVEENGLSRGLCGASRPGHFRGVLTVVAKLFNLTLPDMAVFGQKDAQQARLIRQMTHDLNFPVRIVLGAIVRESDGLAMSSRNKYLSADERASAICLNVALRQARAMYRAGERDAARLVDAMRAVIKPVPCAQIDYIAAVDNDNLQPVQKISRSILLALAVRIGQTRLIDNLTLPDDALANLPA